LTKLLANRAFSNEHKFYGKVSFENNAASNKLLDVRREQRLYYHVVFLLSACVLSVPAHVNAAVKCLFEKKPRAALFAGRKIAAAGRSQTNT
jgi:hypothetical protein